MKDTAKNYCIRRSQNTKIAANKIHTGIYQFKYYFYLCIGWLPADAF